METNKQRFEPYPVYLPYDLQQLLLGAGGIATDGVDQEDNGKPVRIHTEDRNGRASTLKNNLTIPLCAEMLKKLSRIDLIK